MASAQAGKVLGLPVKCEQDLSTAMTELAFPFCSGPPLTTEGEPPTWAWTQPPSGSAPVLGSQGQIFSGEQM